jgi:hypothetical protein
MITVSTGLTTTTPSSLAPTSQGNAYCVNGAARGVAVIGGVTGYPLGVTTARTITAVSAAATLYYYVSSIDVIEPGENYTSPPSVSVSGLSGVRALLDGPLVGRITFTTSAEDYTSPPQVVITGGQASGAQAKVIVRGSVSSVNVNSNDTFYRAIPAITFAAATLSGVTEIRPAKGRAVVTYNQFSSTTGPVSSVVLTDKGLYEWDSSVLLSGRPVTAVAASATGYTSLPGMVVECSGAVSAITATSGGTGYSTPPSVSFISNGPLRKGGGAQAIAGVTGSAVNEFTLTTYGNGYDGSVRANVVSDRAVAIAVMAPRLAGTYLCGVRLVGRDGVPGNLCPLVTVECGEGASSIVWNLSNITLADGTPNRIAKMELWRTTGDQAITLYKVAEFTATRSGYTDSMTDAKVSDATRSGYAEMRILTEEGYTNAYRFGVPPSNMSVVTMFQDRAWYAVDTSGTQPNVLYFSEIDEPESVAEDAQVIIQTNGRDSDSITGLMPFDGVMYVGQNRNIVRLTVGTTPYADASATNVSQRGLLNDRCWDRFEDVAYIADSAGLYAFKGSGAESLSDAVGNYWSEPLIDFSKSKWFFLQVNPAEKVVRFYFVAVGSSATYPNTALCYSLITQSWWTETYAQELSSKLSAQRGGGYANYVGSSAGAMRTSAGTMDAGSSISYSLKTGNYPLTNDPKRSVRLTYTPVAGTLGVSLFYNNSSSARPNAAAVSRGDSFTVATGSTEAILDMSATRSALGPSTGFAQLSLSGRMEDRSAGGDRMIAIGLSGVQGGNTPVIHSVEIEGAG